MASSSNHFLPFPFWIWDSLMVVLQQTLTIGIVGNDEGLIELTRCGNAELLILY